MKIIAKFIIAFILLMCFMCLAGCTKTVYVGDAVPQNRYGEECFDKPYSNKYGDSYLCQANAISKLNKQVDIHNGMLK